MRKKITPVNDWCPLEDFAKAVKLPPTTVKYLTRKEVREETGFEHCVQYITPRIAVFSPSRYFEMLNNRQGAA